MRATVEAAGLSPRTKSAHTPLARVTTAAISRWSLRTEVTLDLLHCTWASWPTTKAGSRTDTQVMVEALAHYLHRGCPLTFPEPAVRESKGPSPDSSSITAR